MKAFWCASAAATAAVLLVSAAPAGATSTAPTVSSFTPKRGAASALVTITGSRFVVGATTVDFNGTTSDTVTVVSTTRLKAVVPDGATSGQIGITTSHGTGHSVGSFTVAAPPQITDVEPASGKIGAAITLTGTSFTGATSVLFNGTKATYTVLSSTSIRATVPKGAEDGPITVAIPGATGDSPSDFDVLFPPSVSSFSPIFGAPGDSITIDGANLTDDTIVKFGSKIADVAFENPGELTATVPSLARTGKISVSNSLGSGTSAQSFTIQSAPAISSFTPTSGKSGTTVTIKGSGFYGATEVTFAGVDAWSFTSVSDSKITAVVGPNAAKGNIVVTTNAGTATSSGKFTGSPFVLRTELSSALDSTDPALGYNTSTWQMEYATCLALLQYPDTSGQPGTLLQPDAATAFPDVSADGLTYTFTIRDGLGFPAGESVTAATFKHAIERAVDPALNGPAGTFMTDVVGESDYVSGDADSISGIVADGQTLTFTLTQNDPDFEARLAMPFFCAVPLDTPDTAQTVIPAAGPYTIDSIDGSKITLLRNPNYAGSRPRNPDEIDLTQNVASSSLLPDVAKGANADYTNSLSGSDLSKAMAKYPKQTVVNPLNGFRYFALNTSRDAFASVAARQAVNLVLNRNAIAAAYGATNSPTDQYLSPGMPGYTDAKIYPLAGPSASQLAQARQLANDSGLAGTTIEYWTCPSATCASVANLVESELARIQVSVNVTTFQNVYGPAGTLGAAFDMVGPVGWINDYPDPVDTLNVLLDGTSIGPTNNLDLSYFNDPTYNEKLAEAELMSGGDRYSTYGALDVDLAQNEAPLAAVSLLTQIDLFAPEIGCRVDQPTYGTDLAALCSS